jgi:uncharacterized damage-inducible protein DinB
MSDVTLTRLFRHMAWANNQLFTQLSTLPVSALSYAAWNPEWTVGKIANHIVIAQGRLIARLEKRTAPEELEFPLSSQGMKDLAKQAAVNDQKIQTMLDMPEEMLTFVRYGETVSFLSTSVIAQFVHHATEHRAQIANIMAVNKMDVINLDAIDLWSFERFERG